MKIACHEINDPCIARIFMIRLQNPQGNHVRPKILSTLCFCARAEVAVLTLALQYGFYPYFCFVQHRLVFKKISHSGISSKPIWNFFPAPLASGFQPSVVFFLKPSTDLTQMSVQTVFLKLELSQQPSIRLYASGRQFDKLLRHHGCPITYIVYVLFFCRNSIYHLGIFGNP